jgi:hypothetical protein
MSQIPVQTEKLYTAEELSTDKYYKRGENAYKLLEKLEYRESYPNVFSRLYNFECININTGNRYTEEIAINPRYHCFSEILESELINVLSDLESYSKSIKKIMETNFA